MDETAAENGFIARAEASLTRESLASGDDSSRPLKPSGERTLRYGPLTIANVQVDVYVPR